MEIKAVIFDLYGVLALNGWQAFKAKHFATREDVWTEVFELGRLVDAKQADYADLVRFTAEKTGESEDTVRYQLEHTITNDQLLNYIETTLRSHYKLGILSNASTNVVVDVFSPQQRDLFDVCVLSHDVKFTKPDPRMYQTVASRLGVEPGNCLYVDDQERHIVGADAVGMQTLLYKDFKQFQKRMQDLQSA